MRRLVSEEKGETDVRGKGIRERYQRKDMKELHLGTKIRPWCGG